MDTSKNINDLNKFKGSKILCLSTILIVYFLNNTVEYLNIFMVSVLNVDSLKACFIELKKILKIGSWKRGYFKEEHF